MPNRLSTYTVHWRSPDQEEHEYRVRFGLLQLEVEKYRRTSGATYEEIAGRMGIERTSLYRLTSGRKVGPRVLAACIRFLGLDEVDVLVAAPGAPALLQVLEQEPPAPATGPGRRDLGLLSAALACLVGLVLLYLLRHRAPDPALGVAQFLVGSLALPIWVIAVLFIPRHFLLLLTATTWAEQAIGVLSGSLPWPVALLQATWTLAFVLLLPWLKRREERSRTGELAAALAPEPRPEALQDVS